jgi:hypothetical protein
MLLPRPGLRPAFAGRSLLFLSSTRGFGGRRPAGGAGEPSGIIRRVPHRAYISVWFEDFGEEVMLERIERFLEMVPFSGSCPGITSLVIRAVGPEEAPLIERDLRNRPLSPGEAVALIAELLHGDSSYEFEAYWDLWFFDQELGRWQLEPRRLEILCCGPDYDDRGCAETGHVWVQAGIEQLFLGEGEAGDPSPSEASEKARENARRLLGWVHQMEAKLPLERTRIWSEGEGDFEARLEKVLAVG